MTNDKLRCPNANNANDANERKYIIWRAWRANTEVRPYTASDG